MKIIFSTLAFAALLAGCNSEQIGSNSNEQMDNRVSFEASVSKTVSRAATNNPFAITKDLQDYVGTFNVSGFTTTATTPLMDQAVVSWAGSSWEFSGPYWPDAAVDFYAYANWTTAPTTVVATGITATDVEIGQDKLDATGHKDMLVAIALGETKKPRTTLTFKHALTQVIFKAGNVDKSNLEVRIGGLRLVNIASKATMTGLKADNAIKWIAHSTPTQYYVQGLQADDATKFGAATVAAASPVEVQDAVGKDYSNYTRLQLAGATGSNSLLLIPQTFTAWDPTGTTLDNTYIELLAVINATGKRSDAAAAGDQGFYYCGTPKLGASGVADQYGKIYIPIQSILGDNSEWVAGKTVNYIITFGDKNSGSGGGGYDENGDPILVPIRFTAVVDAWTEVNVPLLTATFETTSSDIKAALVDGFTTQLLADIAAAPEVKTYRAAININGTLLNDVALAFATTSNAKIAATSTITYDFTKVTTWTAGKTVSMVVPVGFSAVSYFKATTTAVATVAAGATITLNGTTATRFVLTRLP